MDGSISNWANVSRARTQKIRRVRGKVWWAKRRRKIVRRDNGKVVEFGFSARFSFWHIKEWQGIFKVFEVLLVDA